MRVQFANSQLVSDHPSAWGGTDTGPAPGDIIVMALTSASALAGRQYATAHDLAVGHIGSRGSMNTIQEGFADELQINALPHLTYVDRFWRLLEADGNLTAEEQAALVEAMSENRIARTIRQGIALDESIVILPSRAQTRPNSGVGNTLLKNRTPLPPGEKRTAAVADSWRVSASALDDRTCLVKAAGSMSVIGDRITSGRSATPEELLLGGLAACTTIYIARNAQFHDIPVESVKVKVSADIPEDSSRPIASAVKIAEIMGDFSSDQRAKLDQFAGYCAFGVTLSRATPITDNLQISGTSAGSGYAPILAAFEDQAPVPTDPAFCDDGSCCIPAPAGQEI